MSAATKSTTVAVAKVSVGTSMGAFVGNASAGAVNLFDHMVEDTGSFVSDFSEGYSAAYSARRAKDIAARAQPPVLVASAGRRVRKA